jgi:hypothetical protein
VRRWLAFWWPVLLLGLVLAAGCALGIYIPWSHGVRLW